ncbi:hypothetical protein [Pedobacter sp. NJ-S-72]
MKLQHPGTPIIGLDGKIWHIYHKDSFILTQLRYFPFIQLGVIGLFLLTAYVAFSSARRSEQDQVWVGMAKKKLPISWEPLSLH